MARTPEEWLPILAKRMDERMPRIVRNRRYSEGDADLPEMGRNLRAAWESFQRKARTDLAGTLCASMSGRIIPQDVTVGDDDGLTQELRRVWRDNRLSVVFSDAVWDSLATSVGYVATGLRNGKPVITSERPEQMVTFPDEAQPWRAQAALKAWRDSLTGVDRAIVWADGVKQPFSRSSKTESGSLRGVVSGGWEPDGLAETYTGELPVFALDNHRGFAEFEAHVDVIDRINTGKLQRLVITSMQAFKQRMLKGGLPELDQDGNAIDYTGVFDPAPGAIWDLPEGIDIQELGADDIRPLLDGEKADLRDFAAVTRTPIDVFIPDNQSAEGAKNMPKGEIQKAKDRIKRFGAPLEGALLSALRAIGEETEQTIEVVFANPEHVSVSEKTAAAVQAKAAGMSSRWISRHIMGMSPAEIDRDEADRAREQLQAAFLIGGQGDAAAAG